MGAEAERDVLVRGAGDVERFGVNKVGGVAVGRRIHHQHLIAGRDDGAVEVVVGDGNAAHVVNGRDVADELFDCHGEVGAVLEARPLLGVGVQVEQRAADNGAGGLGAAIEQQQCVGDGFVDAKWVTGNFDGGVQTH